MNSNVGILVKAASRDGLLHLTDGSGDLDFPWAGQGAVEYGMAAINTELVV